MNNSGNSHNSESESIDEPAAKRIKIEPETSTSSKPESKDLFLTLPSDVLSKIIAYIPIAQWPSLELLDQNFRANTLSAYRQLRTVNVEREFIIKSEYEQDRSSFGKSIISILRKLIEHTPFLTSLSGIDISSNYVKFNSDAVQLLVQFEHLQSITIGNAKLFNHRRGIEFDSAADFLKRTRSRASLKEVRFYNVFEHGADRPPVLDQSSQVNCRETRAPLEKISFTSTYDSLSISLDTIDTTRLTDVRLGKAYVEPEELINLIERASNLDRIELAFIGCNDECNGPRLEANKKLLTALASHENLTSMKFAYVGSYCDTECTDFEREFYDMLRSIGRRGKLRKLALEKSFAPFIEVNELCLAICKYVPYLQSIKLNIDYVTEEILRYLVNLTELREIHFTNVYAPQTPIAIFRKIARLPHLKRLYLDASNDKDRYRNMLECLGDANMLTDLRIRYAHLIADVVFEEWSDGFGSNLQILMLGKVATKDEFDEKGLVRLLEKAVNLRVLILEGHITGQSLKAIAKPACPDLEILGLRSTRKNIAVQRFQNILDRCPKLKRFGGFKDEIRKQLRFPKYRKIADVDTRFWTYDFDDSEYV